MVGSIGSSGNYGMQAMQQQMFKKVDTDSSGGISQDELKTLATDLSNKTGKSIKVDDTSFTSYDSDGSGTLSSKELMNALQSNGFGPPQGMGGAGEMMGPPPAKDQAATAYAANADGDSLATLIAGLQKLMEQLQSGSGDQSTDTASVSNNQNGPNPQDFFKKVDTDSSGTISKDELTTMAEKLKQMTGQSITVSDDTFTTADSNNDDSLNNDELKSFMDKSGFAPPPPPPGGMDRVMSSDTASSDSTKTGSAGSKSSNQDQIDLLKIMLEKLTQFSKASESTAADSLLNVSA